MNSIKNEEDEWLIPKSDISFEYLKKFNRNAMFLHLVQGILMVLFGFLPFLDFSVDIYTFYLEFDLGPPPTLAPNPEVVFTFTALGAFVGTFLLLSALAHFLITYPLNKIYIKDLKEWNKQGAMV